MKNPFHIFVSKTAPDLRRCSSGTGFIFDNIDQFLVHWQFMVRILRPKWTFLLLQTSAMWKRKIIAANCRLLFCALYFYYTPASHKTFFYTLCFTLWHKSRLFYMYHILHTSYSHVSAGKSPLQITSLGKAVILPQVVPKKMDWKCKQDMSDWIASMFLCPHCLNHICHENFTHFENWNLGKYHCNSDFVDLIKKSLQKFIKDILQNNSMRLSLSNSDYSLKK